jgi:RNA polymerase sigma factor (sigma-70 family)
MTRAPLRTAVQLLQTILNKGQLACLNDGELLERFCRDQDQAAFALLVQRHGGLVWSVCWRILHQEQDTEDSYQASFLVLARNAASIRNGQTVACWLYRVASRIARKAALDRSKRRQHERARPRPQHRQAVDELSWRELQDVLQQELARLPEKHQAPFVLCCLDGKSKAEAARLLGWKEGTVSSRLAHARKLMQQHLSRRGLALSAVLCACAVLLRPDPAPAARAAAAATAARWLCAGRKLSTFLSSEVITLIQGVEKSMCFASLQKCVMVVLVICLLGAGGGVWAWQRSPAEPPSEPAPAALAPAGDEARKAEEAAPAPPAKSPPGQPWIGFASRETNAGPELVLWFADGTRKTVEAAADSVLLSYLPDQPLGAHECLSVDLADSNRVLLRFDWPTDAEVEKAELILSRSQSRHPYPSEALKLALHTITEPWSESTATWNRQPAFLRQPALTARINPLHKEYHIDVTALVRPAKQAQTPRHGWLIRIARPLPARRASAEGKPPAGWMCLGKEYVYALDSAVRHGGQYSCRIQSTETRPSGFAMLSQTIRADAYHGQRLRFSGQIKTDRLSGMATLWMRIDGENELLAIDKTVEGAVRGTADWQQPRIVLDVPEDSKTIRLAVLVEGTGQAWVDDLKLETVDRTVPVTNASAHAEVKEHTARLPLRPRNLDFEADTVR